MQSVRCAPQTIVYSMIVALAAQGRVVPAQYRDGALPLIPVQAIAGGEVYLELTVSSSGVVSTVRTLRATPPFTDAMSNAVRGWQFRPAEEEMEPEPGQPVDPKPRKVVGSKVLVVGIFRPPTLNTPTVGEPPKEVASASDEAPFPLATVTPLYPPLARDNGIVLVEVRVDPRGVVVDAKAIRSAPPFDQPALDASRRWTFRPARVHGTSIASLAYIAFAFRQPITVGQAPDNPTRTLDRPFGTTERWPYRRPLLIPPNAVPAQFKIRLAGRTGRCAGSGSAQDPGSCSRPRCGPAPALYCC